MTAAAVHVEEEEGAAAVVIRFLLDRLGATVAAVRVQIHDHGLAHAANHPSQVGVEVEVQVAATAEGVKEAEMVQEQVQVQERRGVTPRPIVSMRNHERR